jgi:glucose repression regulatory protein TUP1
LLLYTHYLYHPLDVVGSVKTGAGPLNSSNASDALGDINPENVPANMKVEGQDWFAL